MKSYSHVLAVLAINAKIAEAYFHYTECDMTKLKQSVICILKTRMSRNTPGYGFKTYVKKSTVLNKIVLVEISTKYKHCYR